MMRTVDSVRNEAGLAREAMDSDHGGTDICIMPPRMPSPMMEQEIIVWTPSRVFDATVSRFVGARPPRTRYSVRSWAAWISSGWISG